MCPPVLGKVAGQPETFTTHPARIRPLACVCPKMGSQVLLSLEHFTTLDAVVPDCTKVFGLDFAVERPQVRLEAGFVLQDFATQLAGGWRRRLLVTLCVGR